MKEDQQRKIEEIENHYERLEGLMISFLNEGKTVS